MSSVNYYGSVYQALGGTGKTMSSYRLFMVPGMQHCGGGDGTNTFDMLTSLEQWVEKGTAPSFIAASHATGGVVDKTRPLCPYPQTANYVGTGSTNDIANFICK